MVEQVDVWKVIPWELVYSIWVQYLEPTDVLVTALVNQHWRELSFNNDVWKAWYSQRFGRAIASQPDAKEIDYLELFKTTLKEHPVQTMKVVIVGDAGCFKTKLCQRLVFGVVHGGYLPTVLNTFVLTVPTPSHRRIVVYVHDTAGFEDYDRLRPLSYRDTDVVLICCRAGNGEAALRSQKSIKTRWLLEISHHVPTASIVNVVLCDDNAEGWIPSSDVINTPVLCNVTTGEGVPELLQQVVKTYLDRWHQSYQRTKAETLDSYNRKENLLSNLQEFVDLKLDFTGVVEGKQLSALEFIKDPEHFIRELSDTSSTYYHECLALGKVFQQDYKEENIHQPPELPKDVECQTMAYITFLLKFLETIRVLDTDENILMAATQHLVQPDTTQLNQDNITKLLIELLSFIIQFDTSDAPMNIANGLAAAVLANIGGILWSQSNIDAQSVNDLRFMMTHPMPLFNLLKTRPPYMGPEQKRARATLMAGIANLCAAILNQKEVKFDSVDKYCRAMTAAILFHSFVSDETFEEQSPIHIEQCLRTLFDLHKHQLLDVILHGISAPRFQRSSATVQDLLLRHN